MLNNFTSELNKLTMIELKKICNIYKIPKLKPIKVLKKETEENETVEEEPSEIQTLQPALQIKRSNKKDIVMKITMYYSSKIIQKFFRRKYAIEKICPITQEVARYPYFAFKPKGQTLFIYYNLKDLSEYLINSGNFKDPKTREIYSDDVLKKIDIELSKHKIVLPVPPIVRTVFKASKQKTHYKNKKELENHILVYERCLDDTIDIARSILEGKDIRGNNLFRFFIEFRKYFKSLASKSNNSALALLDRTILIMNNTVKKEENSFSDVSLMRDNIISFLYQVKFEELNL